MLLDLRLPLGLLFVSIGVLVTAEGLIAGPAAVAAGLPIDLIWGLGMAAFGAAAVALALVARRTLR